MDSPFCREDGQGRRLVRQVMKAKLDLGDEGGAVGVNWPSKMGSFAQANVGCLFAPIGWIPMLDVGCVFCHFFCYAFFLKTFLINEDGRNFGPRFSPQKGMNGSNTSM